MKLLRCDKCGRLISYKDFDNKLAKRTLITPDSQYTSEKYETLCKDCNKKEYL